MKKSLRKSFFLLMASMCCFALPCAFASDSDSEETEDQYVYQKGEVVIPAAKRPKPATKEQLSASDLKDDKKSGNEYLEKCNDTFKYGLKDEITELIDTLTKDEDMRFVDQIYDLFLTSKDTVVKQKVLQYFTKIKDPCLEDFAVTILQDPYDEKKETVNACFDYVSAVQSKAAIPCLVTLIEKEEESYFNQALTTIGDVGGSEEAMFLISYLDRDDLTVSQRQQLMRVLGKIKAVDTWERLSEIAQDTDENSFVRMYAAEAIGAMEVPESEDILIELFESEDPNFRVYVLKGLSYYKDSKADEVILQALRDNQWKVRQEAVNTVSARTLVAASPYLIYRCKDSKEEKVIKDKCYNVLAKLNTEDGNKYLIGILGDNKMSDNTKATVASALLEYNYAGKDEILKLAEESLTKDTMKNLRYSLGKEFAKYGRPEYADICMKYIEHKDVATQGTGLDIFAKGRYASVRPKVEELAKEADPPVTETADGKPAPAKKVNANAKKAKKILEKVDSF